MNKFEIWRNAVQLHEAYAVFVSDEQKTSFAPSGQQNLVDKFRVLKSGGA